MAEIAKAKVKYIRAIPLKARLVIDLIRGKKVEDALNIVSFMPHTVAKVVKKLLKSAIANAGQRKGVDQSNLYIEKIFVDEGPRLKRFRPRSMGRANVILKRMSHITVVLGDKKVIKGEKSGAKNPSNRI